MEYAPPATGNGYTVELDVFSGPLDLLLYLIRKEEVDIYEIPIHRITQQYLRYIEMMQTLNLEIAGEFILMAATLIRIKTRLLLPKDEDEADDFDPREELIMALIEYKKYKEAGELLREHALEEERNFVPPSPVGRFETKVDLSPATGLYDMLSAFLEVVQANREETLHEVQTDDVTVEERMEVVLDVLRERDSATFGEIFGTLQRKLVAVVTFIALLELTRIRRISVRQAVPFSELRVYRGDRYGDAEAVAVTSTTTPVTTN